MAKPQDYYNSVIGKAYDEDKVFGVQCVDGFKHFCRTILGLNISKESICNPTGLATSIWDNYYSLGLNKYFDLVPNNKMVDGDWAIWKKGSKGCPSSHVAMFRKDNGNGTGIFLGQNQSTKNRGYTQVNISYDGVRGGLRPKIYHQAKSSNSTKADQLLYKGSKVRFNGIFKVDAIDVKNNLFGSNALTGARTRPYHWIPSEPFVEVNSQGDSQGQDQYLHVGELVKNDNIYNVEDIDIPSNSAKLNINGRTVWVYSRYLYEVSNN